MQHTAVMELLAENRADVNQVRRHRHLDYNTRFAHQQLAPQTRADGFFPLLAAVKNNRLDHVEWLLTAQADVSQVYPQGGNTALMTASLHGQASIVRTLLTRNAEVAYLKHDGGSALLAACNHGDAEVVDMLLNAKADPSQCGRLLVSVDAGR